jgi:hypothetical protein
MRGIKMKTIWVIATDQQESAGWNTTIRQVRLRMEGRGMEGTPLAFASEELALEHLKKDSWAKLLKQKPVELNLVEILE